VKEHKEIGLDFIIDKLTNSIENVVTGDSFATDISLLKSSDLKKNYKKKTIGYLIGNINSSNHKEMFLN
jgi:hypothetical protein